MPSMKQSFSKLQASTSIVTLERGIKSNVNVSSVGISTRHPLIIDASSSVDLDNKQVALQVTFELCSTE